MRGTILRRLLPQTSFVNSTEFVPSCKAALRCLRQLSNSTRRQADENDSYTRPPQSARSLPRSAATPSPRSPSLHDKAAPPSAGLRNLADVFSQFTQEQSRNTSRGALRMNAMSSGDLMPNLNEIEKEPHRLSVFATRHNTHITVTGPAGCKILKPDLKKDKPFNGGVLISVSTGNIGFKKSGRKHYDSAFQLASYVMTRLQEAGISADIQKLEVSLRGFGAGREAVTKALLGSEGRFLRGKVVKVADNTRLKFGGTRSRKPRRLG